MSHNIKHKLRHHIFEGAAIATIMIPMASPIIAHATDTPTPVKVSTIGTKVKIDDADLQKSIADAKAAGVDLTQEKTDTQTVKSSEVALAKSKISESYKSQISSLEAATKAQKAQDDGYNKKEAQYEKNKAAFDKQEEENKDKDGHPSETVLQQLLLQAEDNVKMSSSLKSTDGHYYDGKTNDVGNKATLVYRYDNKDDSSNKNANGVSSSWYHVQLKKGKSFTTTHENLQNASYKGRKITKMVQVVTNNDNNTDDGNIDLMVASDPSLGVWYNGAVDKTNGAKRTITDDRTYYYADGSKVIFDDNNAYISVGSLNTGYLSNNGKSDSLHIEKSKANAGTLVPINGGTIKAQKDGFDYADMNSWFNADGSVFQSPFNNGQKWANDIWDTGSSQYRWYGTGVYKLKSGTSTISLSAETISQRADSNPTTWWTSSTTMPFNTAPIPPVKSTPKKATYKLSELYTTPEPHKSETDDSGKDNNGQNVKPGQTLKYKLTWDLKGLEAIDVDKDTLAKGLSFMDDYDETKLDITDQTKKDFTVIDAKTQKSVMDELQQDWDIKNGKWTLKAKNVQDFLTNHAGHELTITFNPVVKKDATGTVTNTAVQNDFGQDFDTETVKNPITPDTPKPDTPSTPNTSYGEAPKGWLYGAIAAIALAGTAFGFRKPIKKWFHK
ncbi:SspB-related isopeptide-forming adhesin [Leuconostoc citreum]|uniref:SspB-related isopeptide-forming adhesin n=1 Tax=Leuconostoc citreum TaxID=33964 RepID=UPI002A80E7FE|nr:SspB-related isopeptide-forming adhesin [Leuconostoc citreum]MDY5161808.1 GbpC/Spa domain-containing protein [Leuconostoc citreum]MDY5165378.1 GbpC/Spa domain-containing protein [Leuconostoc citreum]